MPQMLHSLEFTLASMREISVVLGLKSLGQHSGHNGLPSITWMQNRLHALLPHPEQVP